MTTTPQPIDDLSHLQIDAFWIVRPKQGVICTEPIPSLYSGQVCIRVLYSGFNGETEKLILSGKADQEWGESLGGIGINGQFPAPIKYGDSVVGIIEKGPSPLIGKMVYCQYPHQNYLIIPQSQIYVLPPKLSARRALLSTEMERALCAVWKASPKIGEKVLVLGENTTAYLIAYLVAQIKACEVQVLAHHTQSFYFADQLHFDCISPEELRLQQQQYDIVIHCTADDDSMQIALQSATDVAKIIDCSYFLRKGIAFTPQIFKKKIDYQTAHPKYMSLPKHWDDKAVKKLVFQLLLDPQLECLLSKTECSFLDLPTILDEKTSMNTPILYQPVLYPIHVI